MNPYWWASAPHLVGWSQPPRPADVVASFDPHASKQDQARAVLFDYYHDDPLRYWSDNEAVKRCFIGGSDPRKENHDPLLLIQAYENPHDPIWNCHGTGMSWHEMNDAVQQAIAHRKKLGPLPKSSYDTDPVVIYYYDNDKMKRITYPGLSIVPALNTGNNRWWAWGMGDGSDAGKAAGKDDVHTRETDDPKKIQVEREHPGWITKADKQKLKAKYPWLSDMESGSAGDWQSEGSQWDKDIAGTGVIGSITGAILALVSAVLDVTGFGAILGIPLGIATPFIVAAINATDTALHAGDIGAAMANLGPALIQASIQAVAKGASAGGVKIPPAILQAAGTAVSAISKDVQAAQQKNQDDFGKIWDSVAKKAKSYGKLGDKEAEAIAHVLSGKTPAAGHVFIQGYLAGKLLDSKQMAGLAKVLRSYATFADPRIINIALLGMGIGHLTQAQQKSPISRIFPHAAHGEFAALGDGRTAKDDLRDFIQHELLPRYAVEHVGQATPTPNPNDRDWSGISQGCPHGYWWNSLDGRCELATPLPSPGPGGVPPLPGGTHAASGEWDSPELAHARAAQEALKDVIGKPEWLSGIGIDKGDNGDYRVRVNTAWMDDDVIASIPGEILGVPVAVMEVGRIVALTAGMPTGTAPPEFWRSGVGEEFPIPEFAREYAYSDLGGEDPALESAIANLSERYLGQLGIVSIADRVSEDGRLYIAVLTEEPAAAEAMLPQETNGFAIVVEPSGPIVPYAYGDSSW